MSFAWHEPDSELLIALRPGREDGPAIELALGARRAGGGSQLRSQRVRIRPNFDGCWRPAMTATTRTSGLLRTDTYLPWTPTDQTVLGSAHGATEHAGKVPPRTSATTHRVSASPAKFRRRLAGAGREWPRTSKTTNKGVPWARKTRKRCAAEYRRLGEMVHLPVITAPPGSGPGGTVSFGSARRD